MAQYTFSKRVLWSDPERKRWVSLISTSCACSPAEAGYKGSSEEYKLISIRSNADFDTSHLKGAELNDLFVVPVNGGPSMIAIKDYIKLHPRLTSPSLDIKLDHHPDISKKHLFTFTVELKNAEVYTLEKEIIFE